ncbi:MAG: hypothetical protein ACWA5A_00405 [Marinibacterium sp.]
MRYILPLLAALSLASAPAAFAQDGQVSGNGQTTGKASFFSHFWSGQSNGSERQVRGVGQRIELGLAGWIGERVFQPAGAGTDRQRGGFGSAGRSSHAPGQAGGYQTVGRSSGGWDISVGGESGSLTGSSEYTPERQLVGPRPRNQFRAGLNMRRDNVSTFYGVGWLGEKFDWQPDDNLVGSLQVQLRF